MFVIRIDVEGFEKETDVFGEACEGATAAVIHGAVEVAAKAGAESAKLNHRYKDGTGALRFGETSLTDSIHAEPAVGGGGESSADMVADKYTASYLEEGTQPHAIDPANKEVLMWWDGGEQRFAKHVDHPGTRPYFFMRDAAVVAEQVLEATIERQLPAALREVLGGQAGRMRRAAAAIRRGTAGLRAGIKGSGL